MTYLRLKGLICLMSTEKPEKAKIIKDDKNRLELKLTSVPPTFSLLLSSCSPPDNNTLQSPTPSLFLYLETSTFINSPEQGAPGKWHEKVKNHGSKQTVLSNQQQQCLLYRKYLMVVLCPYQFHDK